MVERQAGDPPWDIAAITAHLNAEPETARDIRFGIGVRLPLGSSGESVLELYPKHSVGRYVAPNLELTLSEIEPPSVRDGQILLAHRSTDGDSFLAAIDPGGHVVLAHALDANEVPEHDDAAKAESPNGERAVLAEPVAEQAQTPEPERQRRTVAGRVGAAPGFRTTPNGITVARFPVAVHNDDGSTTWETVVVFGPRAERLRGVLQKGQQVEVIGYSHEREVRRRDGSHKTVQELYGAVVRSR